MKVFTDSPAGAATAAGRGAGTNPNTLQEEEEHPSRTDQPRKRFHPTAQLSSL